MKRKLLLNIVAVTGLLISSVGPMSTSAASEPAASNTDENVLVTVNGTPITKLMFVLYFQERMRNRPDTDNTPQQQSMALNELVDFMLVSQDALKQGLDGKEEVVAAIDVQRIQLLARAAIQVNARGNQPDEAALKKAYDAEYANASGKEYKARHILLENEEDAKKIIRDLDQGKDFSALAKEHSVGPSGKEGGDLGWFDTSQMVPDFSKAVEAMEKDKYSKSPVKTQFGWHVIKLEDTREMAAPKFDDVKPKLATNLQRVALRDYIAKLRDGAKIQLNEAALKQPEEASDAAAADKK